MSNIAVEVAGLIRRFGTRAALDGVDFGVRLGDIFGLLGPNGGGKSTLFRILCTHLAPTGGTARIFGLDVQADAAAVRARIGVVFQSPGLDKKLSVAENLHHQGQLYGIHGRPLRQRIDQLLGRFGLTDRARERVETLSGGLARRVEVAKGMLHNPELLLLDEPSTGLDPAARRQLWTQLEQVREQDGVTVLLTTHMLEEADRCDRLVLLDRGHVVADGSPRELKSEIAGEVITIEAPEPEELCRTIAERFSVTGKVIYGTVRLEQPNAHQFAHSVAQAFGDQMDTVTVGRPTLEDVFLDKTGHSLGVGEEQGGEG